MIQQWILENPNLFRVLAFLSLLGLLALSEILSPRRKSYGYKGRRWFANLAILVVSILLLKLVFPLLAVEVSFLSTEQQWGMFHYYQYPYWLNIALGLLILDLSIYLQHVMFHAVPGFWRFHKMHHADLDFDVSTGLRFHPVEMILSMGIKIMIVAAFGIVPLGVLLFEVFLNAGSMFTHTNIVIPSRLEWFVRWLVVTPEMHRVHHSVIKSETNSNFGFNLSLWDRLFGTYKQDPKEGYLGMTIGIPEFREPKYLRFRWLLSIPFLRQSFYRKK